MDWLTVAALLTMVLLLAVGVEIIAVLGLGTILLTLTQQNFPLLNIGMSSFSAINLFPIIAVPLFILTGDLVAESGISRRLTDFSRAVVGWLHGGLIITSIVAAGFFAAISGSNAATVAAIGRIMIPEMKRDRYPIDFAAASMASGGTVGIIIPPSIVFVIYGVATGVPIGDLFLAGLLPGVLMMVAMAATAFFLSRRNAWGTRTPFAARTLMRGAWRAKLAFGASVIILGGIYGGVFTPTEAAAVAVGYCFIVGVFGTRELKLRAVPAILNRSADVNGMIAPIVAMAIILSQIVAVLGIPEAGVRAFLGLAENPHVIVFIVLAVLLVAGAVMEAMPNVMLLTPMLTPLAVKLGMDPVHFGVVMVVALAIGFVTPPVGINLYVASSISNVPFTRIATHSLPYVVSLLIALLVITYVPALSLVFIK